MRVRDVMTTELVTARPDTSFQDLVDLMVRSDISGIPVVDEDQRLVGIVTEADLVSKEAFGGHRRRALEVIADLLASGEARWAIKGRGRRADHVMTRSLVTGRPQDTIQAAARTMLDAGVKRLPIVDADGRVVGVISRTDLLHELHRSDEELRKEIVKAFADPLRSPERTEVNIAVERGEVTLTGTVEFPADVRFVAALAWSITGVVDVHNLTTARNEEPRLSEL